MRLVLSELFHFIKVRIIVFLRKFLFVFSCGGLSSLGIAKACDCDKPCDTLQEKLDAGDENAKAEYEQKFAKKDDDSQFYEVK